MNETLIGQTTCQITFGYVDPATRVLIRTEKRPAGTEVYARLRKDGMFGIRVPGTLLTQVVSAASVESF